MPGSYGLSELLDALPDPAHGACERASNRVTVGLQRSAAAFWAISSRRFFDSLAAQAVESLLTATRQESSLNRLCLLAAPAEPHQRK
jgi:hypothetical protein